MRIRNARSFRRSTRAALAVSSLALSLGFVIPAQGAPPIRFSGELGGLVTDVAGRPQPGALVLLLNKDEHVLGRAATDALGAFAFGDLSPDTYSIHISLLNFVPAVKDRLQIRPGMRSLLEVNLSRVFSSIQLVSMAPVSGSLMSDSWKWALRADSGMRPILRFLPGQTGNSTDSVAFGTTLFADSRGMVRISAADGATSSDGQADFGTQFAFSTSLNKDNYLHLAGDVGYAPGSTAPSAAIRTTWSRELPTGDTPEVAVTLRQIYVPLRIGQGVISNNGGTQTDGQLPALRTLGTSFQNRKEISNSLEMEYGFAYDNVSFLDSGHYFSPWARLTYAIPRGKLDFTWTSGNPRPDLSMETLPASDGLGLSSQNADDLQRELAEVGVLPRVTLADGHARVQRGENFEIGVSQRFGSREFRVAANHETVSNTTLDIASSAIGLFPGDLVPDLFSNSSLFDMGKFDAFGYNASITQDFGDNYKVSVIYGSEGVLSPRGATVENADDLRRLMTAEHRPAVTLRASATIRGTGTRLVASYQWTDYQHATPLPLFSTETPRPEPGLNIIVRQPMPAIPGVACRLEATAELSNLLAQGYLPLTTAGGSRFLVINTPRMVRGGLAFVF